MNIHTILNILVRPFRKKRMVNFLKLMSPLQKDKILDVGGTAYNWKLINYKERVTLLNLTNSHINLPSNLSYVVGDGTALKYDDNEFDIVFSNSVIEHVGSLNKQKNFANEVCRVGRKIWIQTPAKEFFLEPHLITPFIHWLPKGLQKKLLRNFTLWGLITRPNQKYIDDFVDQTRLLSFKEVVCLFPNCTILKEKFLFMTKSYVIIK